MTALPAPGVRVAARPAGAAWLVRLTAFVALGLYAGGHWGQIVRPADQGSMFAMLVIALAAGIAAPSAWEQVGRVRRPAAVAGLTLTTLGAILLAAHAPARTLRPDRWDQLVSHIGGALGALPSLRIPYLGEEPWVSVVLLAGGGLLLAAAACLVLGPRPRTFAAAICLGVLYTVPIVEHTPRHPYLDGAAFAVLLGCVLWADRLEPRYASTAAGFGTAAVVAAAIAAPYLDSGRPWVDYQALAETLQAGPTMTFSWNHRYGPLHWSRDGVELARVRARGNVYLKTANLERFDGTSWVQAHDVIPTAADTEIAPRQPSWTQRIHVTIKGLKSTQFLGAGSTLAIDHSSKEMREATPDAFVTSARPLRRGDSYDATVYVPRPSTTRLHEAGSDYPPFVARQLTVDLPIQRGVGPVQISFAPWGSGRATIARGAHGFALIDPRQALRASPYARSFALAEQLRAASSDAYDFVIKTMARVDRDARYTESPPPPGRAAPLEAFLFRDRAGYCQYFAGATALLLRMGGVPARVAAGFSPGTLDGGDHVVRDLDAHSWVEVYFPRIGWVTFDPTPGDAPARSQITDTQSTAASLTGNRPGQRAPGDRLSDPGAGGAAKAAGAGGGPSTLLVASVAIAALLLGAAVAMVLARRRSLAGSADRELDELRLALVRTGRAPSNEMTLRRLEQLLGDSDGALGYLQALRLARYGGGAAPPTPAQRRALRHSLVAGLGPRTRLIALWALPPRPREVLGAVRAALRPRRRRPYTG
jgi:transglutaminase-like putative cysteine protease